MCIRDRAGPVVPRHWDLPVPPVLFLQAVRVQLAALRQRDPPVSQGLIQKVDPLWVAVIRRWDRSLGQAANLHSDLRLGRTSTQRLLP